MKTDTTRQGSWINVYGTQGYSLALGGSRYPSYARVSVAGAATYTWAATTTDPRALQKATGSGRFAATWYGNAFTLDTDLVDGNEHQVGLYVVDWNGGGTRAETIDVVNAATGALLDRRSATAFQGGQYYVWRVKGHVQFRLTRTAGAKAVVSGLFFD